MGSNVNTGVGSLRPLLKVIGYIEKRKRQNFGFLPKRSNELGQRSKFEMAV